MTTPESRRIMTGTTTDEEYHLWLEAIAKDCQAADKPCGGCQQGAVCDWPTPAHEVIRRDREEWEDDDSLDEPDDRSRCQCPFCQCSVRCDTGICSMCLEGGHQG